MVRVRDKGRGIWRQSMREEEVEANKERDKRRVNVQKKER